MSPTLQLTSEESSLFHLRDTPLPLILRLVCLAAEISSTKLKQNVMSHKDSLSVLVESFNRLGQAAKPGWQLTYLMLVTSYANLYRRGLLAFLSSCVTCRPEETLCGSTERKR